MASICQSCGSTIVTWTGRCPECGGSLQLEVKPRQDSMLGKVVANRYRILRKIGQGGMGTVYEAEHIAVGQRVAIKFLNPQFCGDENIVRRFLTEARSYGQISHPHAIQLHDFGQDEEGHLYLSMEYLEGQDLKQVLQQHRRLPVREATDIILQICDALGYAHNKGIVHRDLKPENIMLAKGLRGWHAKVLDFGVARLMDERTRVTVAGSICGTPRYMSPEQAQGLEVDLRSDIYSVGLVYFECLTGVHPFSGASVSEVLRRQISDPVPSLDKVASDLVAPQGLNDIIQRAVAKKPEQRFSSMAKLAIAISHSTGVAELTLPEAPFSTSLVEGDTQLVEQIAQRADANRLVSTTRQRKKWALVAGLFAIVGLGVGIGVAITGEKKEEQFLQELPAIEIGKQQETRLPKEIAPESIENQDRSSEVVIDANAMVEQKKAAAEIRRVGDASLLNLAQAEFEAGHLDIATLTLQKISSTSALHEEAQALRARIEEVSNLMRKAARFYSKGQCSEAVSIYKRVLSRNPGMKAAIQGMARCKREIPVRTMD